MAEVDAEGELDNGELDEVDEVVVDEVEGGGCREGDGRAEDASADVRAGRGGPVGGLAVGVNWIAGGGVRALAAGTSA